MENIADLFRDELNPSERIIWTGRPYQGFMLRPADALFIPFSLMWGGFAIFWERSVVRGGGPFFFILWGVPFVLVGLYIIAGRFFVDILQRRNTYYALTGERAMIISGLFQKSIKSIYLKNLTEVNVSTRGDGWGTITFGPGSPMMWLYGASGLPTTGRYQMPPSFERIEDVKQVHKQLRQLQRSKV